MAKQAQQKQERVIEAVRCGLDGDAAVEFIRQSGFAMTPAGVARHLRKLGGRGNIVALIESGRSNLEILQTVYAELDGDLEAAHIPSQQDLFSENPPAPKVPDNLLMHQDLFESTKITLKIPNDLHEALRIAAKVEDTTQSQLIIDILTSALSRMSFEMPRDEE
tara:strand:- start:55 stop:546 length:492 start_codon:yes stop_codon:yes gene_type:complete